MAESVRGTFDAGQNPKGIAAEDGSNQLTQKGDIRSCTAPLGSGDSISLVGLNVLYAGICFRWLGHLVMVGTYLHQKSSGGAYVVGYLRL